MEPGAFDERGELIALEIHRDETDVFQTEYSACDKIKTGEPCIRIEWRRFWRVV
jgi:hypothetical protein